MFLDVEFGIKKMFVYLNLWKNIIKFDIVIIFFKYWCVVDEEFMGSIFDEKWIEKMFFDYLEWLGFNFFI